MLGDTWLSIWTSEWILVLESLSLKDEREVYLANNLINWSNDNVTVLHFLLYWFLSCKLDLVLLNFLASVAFIVWQFIYITRRTCTNVSITIFNDIIMM